MRVNILIEDSKVAQARENHNNNNILKIPLSATGEYPATHWFCSMVGDDEKIKSIYEKRNLSTMELDTNPKEFLEKNGLKIIR